MLKSLAMTSLAIGLAITAPLPTRGEQATAQSGPLHILVVEYDIVPAEIDKYLTALKELGTASVKEPGFRQLFITRSQKSRTTFCYLRYGTTLRRTLPTSRLITSTNIRRRLEI
jgi:hypothetical protein